MLSVRIFGDPLLRKKSAAVTAFNSDLKLFAQQLTETMRTEDGVGLAAPQVGVSQRIISIEPTGGEQPARVLVNPVITFLSEEREDYEEGCLSVPDIRLSVNRPSRVSVSAVDVDRTPILIEQASGLLARVLQHEIDHLDGILFVDRVSPAQRLLINGKLKKLARSQRNETTTSRSTSATPAL